MAERPLLHVIDGSGYIYRGYYAIRALTTAAGEPTNAIYGFATMIQKVLDEEQPKYLAMVFDADKRSFRSEIYPPYKSNRSAPPEDLIPQLPKIREVTASYRIPQFELGGYEADDIIATLVRFAMEHGLDVRLITGDKDLMQLVCDRVTVWEPMREKRFRRREVVEKYGVPPERMADLLALIGDTSDNIPGIKGVGEKTAAKLLAEHGDLAGVIAAAKEGKIKGKLAENIVAGEEAVALSRRLVTLDEGVPIDFSLDDLAYVGPDVELQQKLFAQFEFKRLLNKVEGPGAVEPPSAPEVVTRTLEHDDYELIDGTSQEALRSLATQIATAGTIAIVMEPDRAQIVDAVIHGLAFAWAPGKVAYVPVPREIEGAGRVLKVLRSVLEDARTVKVSPNAKAWFELCTLHGIALRGVSFDTSIASYLLDPETEDETATMIAVGPDEGPHGIPEVARKLIRRKTIARAAVLGRGRDKRTFESVPHEEAMPLVAERADVALRVLDPLRREIEKADLSGLMMDLELPLSQVLADMELAGLRIDVALLATFRRAFATELGRLEKRCYEISGHTFNIGSPAQLRKVLFEELGLKIIKRTKTGPSTDQSVLEELSSMHDLPQAILDYRQVQKLQSTYVEALPRLVSTRTGRVHTVLSQIVAATGRLSSTEPNLQNIPIRTELGRSLRRAFIPGDGNLMISVDYSQIELRVLAHFCLDPVLVSAFQEGDDVHRRTASAVFEVPPDQVSREQRAAAKTVNFGVLYGMGPVRLARQLQIPRREASQFIEQYFARQPGVQRFIDQTLARAREDGFVRTIMGRRRWVRDVTSKNRGARSAAERIAVNTPVQGSAADLMKLAMIRVHARLKEAAPAAKLLLQVHDELLLEAPAAEAGHVAALVKQEMERAFPLGVPLVADARVGKNWDEAH